MKTIKEVIKKSNQYLITIDDEMIVFDPEIVLKYRLKVGNALEIKDYHQIIHDNDYLIYYKLAVKKLKKMMTAYEMKVFLTEKGSSEAVTKQILKSLKDKRYLDDELYLKTYIQMKSSSFGPKKLSYELKQKGIPFEMIESEISKINELPLINQLISKKLSSLKSKSHHQKLIQLKSFLLHKGFSSEYIDNLLSKLPYDEKSDLTNLKKEYDKLVLKIKSDNPYEKNQKIIAKLYQKGYPIEDIKKIIHS
jgi:regulatory protein